MKSWRQITFLLPLKESKYDPSSWFLILFRASRILAWCLCIKFLSSTFLCAAHETNNFLLKSPLTQPRWLILRLSTTFDLFFSVAIFILKMFTYSFKLFYSCWSTIVIVYSEKLIFWFFFFRFQSWSHGAELVNALSDLLRVPREVFNDIGYV